MVKLFALGNVLPMYKTPENWPSPLKVQVENSKSHIPLLQRIGVAMAEVGIFEIMSRVPPPKGLRQPLSRVTSASLNELVESLQITHKVASEFLGYSFVAVTLCWRIKTPIEQSPKGVRLMIHSAMKEVLQEPNLVNDIVTAAQTLSRLSDAKSKSLAKAEKLNVDDNQRSKIEKIDFFEDRPMDWKSSHWWSGE